MAVRNFDQKFGAEFLELLPGSPGVYLVYDQQDELIYIGKARNLKRRLSQYRNTLRRKKHRRMRGIVKEAAHIEIRCTETHLDACLTEVMLIQKHRPRWNIVGAYSFLYPLIGIRSANGNIEFCMTTTPEAVLKEWPGFEFHGAFRSRQITGDAFFALMRLLRFVGHANPSNRRRRIPRHSYIFSFRRLPSNWAGIWASFYKGESALAMEELILNLVENTGARCRPSKVQEHLDELKRFWRHEVLTLAKVRKATGYTEWPVPQYQRDLVFISYKAGVSSIEDRVKSSTALLGFRHPESEPGGQQDVSHKVGS
jgi:predicted GIY-YIG superfamily endonuclease